MRILTLLLAAIVASSCGRARSAEFGDIADVAPGPDGGMIVLDPLESSVVVLDSTGARAARFGRDGNGPGEFLGAGVSNIASSADTIWVPDLVNQRLAVFDNEGTVLRARALDLSSGLLLDWRAAPGGGVLFRRLADPQRIEWLRGDSATVLTSLQSLGVPSSAGLLAPIPVWCVFPDGRIAMARTDAYDVPVLDGPATTTILRTTGAPERLREEDIEHVKQLMLETMERIPADQISPALVERMLAGVMFPESPPRGTGRMPGPAHSRAASQTNNVAASWVPIPANDGLPSGERRRCQRTSRSAADA